MQSVLSEAEAFLYNNMRLGFFCVLEDFSINSLMGQKWSNGDDRAHKRSHDFSNGCHDLF